jgi:hypothetical protein
MAQVTVDPSTTNNLEEAAKPRARFVAEAIASFDAHASDGHEPTTSCDSLASAGAAHLLDVTARAGGVTARAHCAASAAAPYP